MFEGNRATIIKAENGYVVESGGRAYLHPDPCKAIAELCDMVGLHDLAISTESWHKNQRQEMQAMRDTVVMHEKRADKSEIEMLREKIERLTAPKKPTPRKR